MTLLVGKTAPDFTSLAIMPDDSFESSFNLTKYLNGKMGILFFYAMDFSYVCPTELIAIDKRVNSFKERNVLPIAISVDSHLSHLRWKTIAPERGGIGKVQFPLVSDLTRRVSQGYDVLVNDSLSLRATFLIDKIGVVRHQSVNDLPIGRNIDEMLRTIDALQHHEKTGEVAPAGWVKGKSAMKPDEEGVEKYLSQFKTAL